MTPDKPFPDPSDPIWVPQTFPAPVPDYTPKEMAKMEAAEKKRVRKICVDKPFSLLHPYRYGTH